MLEIIECKTRADMRAFFRAAKKAGYTGEEEKYLKKYAVPPLSLLSKNGPQAYFVAKRNGTSVFRALTGVDFVFNREKGEKTGYFSLFDGERDEEAAQAILNAVLNKQSAWGMENVIGPISPDASGFFMGAGEGDFEKGRGIFTGPEGAFACELLRENGFCPIQTENAYLIQTTNKNPLSDVTRKAEKRFDVSVVPLKPSFVSDQWMKRVLEVTKGAPEKEMRVLLERIRPFIDNRFSYAALISGACAGYLVTLKGRKSILRATTLFTSPDHFSSPAALSLIDAFLTDTQRRRIAEAEVSVINPENMRSERLVLRFGGQKIRSYILFTKKVAQN